MPATSQNLPTLTITLQPLGANTCTVMLAFDNPASNADTGTECGNAEFDFAALQRVARDLAAYGRALSQAVFNTEKLRSYLGKSLVVAQSSGRPYRIQLHLPTDSPWLHSLRWETLCYPQQDGDFLAKKENLRWSRLVGTSFDVVTLRPRSHLRALLAVAAPADLEEHRMAPIDRPLELALARQNLGELEQVSELPPPVTLENLLAALRQGQGYDLLYLVCHGDLNPAGVPLLYLEDQNGNRAEVNGAQLAQRLEQMEATLRPRLVVLASCRSAGTGKSTPDDHSPSPLVASGPLLAAAGIPAVLAMQGSVYQETAQQMLPVFFKELQKDGDLARALAVARGPLLRQPDGNKAFLPPQWWMPVLLTRLKDGRLFAEPSIEQRIQSLLGGLASLPTDYSARINNFLVEYLGTSQRPVPFGGRQAELAALHAWLDDPEAPPYALLATPAGRGKSALLARWTSSLQQEEVQVILLPVSIRFNTALESVVFSALAARLGQVYDEPVQYANLAPEQWRGVCQNFLARTPPDGKTLLVILDGLDEAANWTPGPDLFPFNPPPGVRALVSARLLAGDQDEAGWLSRLGWNVPGRARSLPLPALDSAGVRDVLEAMGQPLAGLASQDELVAQLFRLSQGDPLLVRLYVEALLPYGAQAAALKPADLPSIQAGLDGYFKDWWERQRELWGAQFPLKEKSVQALFNLLACALGPLATQDLLALAPAEAGLDSYALEDGLYRIRRWVIGDGVQSGYAFSHPRLAGFFYERLVAAKEAAKWEAYFLAYGQRTLQALAEGSLAVGEASPYCLQFYSGHLKRAQAAPERFYALLSEGWMRAWYAYEGAYGGFLNDAEQAWRSADQVFLKAVQTPSLAKETQAVLLIQVRAALCAASVAALSSNIRPELLAQALQAGLLTPNQALVLVRQSGDDGHKAGCLKAIAPVLPARWLGEALAAARAIGSEWSRATALGGLAPSLLAEQRGAILGEALAAARAIEYEVYRAQALSDLAPSLPAELLGEALEAAWAIEDKWQQVQVLSGLAARLPPELLGEALAAARKIDEKWQQAQALSNLVSNLPPEQRDAVMSEALAAAWAIEDKWQQAQVLSGLVPNLSPDQRDAAIGEALEAARAIGDEWQRAQALRGLVPNLSPEQRDAAIGEALAAARKIGDEQERAWALSGLAPHLPVEQRGAVLREALQAARAIGDEWRRAWALSDLVPHLPAEQREAVLSEALEAARAIGDEWQRARALSDLAPRLSPELLGEALETARAIGDEWQRAQALSGLVPHLSVELLGEALASARAIGVEWQRALALSDLAAHLSPEMLGEALEAARAIGDENSRARALSDLVPHLPAEQRGSVLSEALAAAWAIEEKWQRAQVLGGLAPHLPAEQRETVMAEVLAAAWALENKWQRALVLNDLAPHLSPEMLGEALEAARKIEEKWQRAQALSWLAPHQPPEQREAAISEALKEARAIDDEWRRAEALSMLVPHLSAEQQKAVLGEALAAARKIEYGEARENVLNWLMPHLPDWAKEDPFSAGLAWVETLHILAHWRRPEFLCDLRALYPFLFAFVPEAQQPARGEQLFRLIQEVARWWP